MPVNIEKITQAVSQSSGFIQDLHNELEKIIIGQNYLIQGLTLSLLTGEHILVEGLPGLA